MRNEFELAFNEIRNQRALSQDVVLEALQTALISAYRRYSGASAAQMVDATIDPATGRTKILVEKEVVDGVENPLTEVSLEKARFYNPEAELNDMVMVEVEGTTKKFGRIAAQTAKQVILQKIREAERNALFDEFSAREGDIVTGTVQSTNPKVVTLSMGRAEAVMPRAQQIPNERYRQHDKLRVYVAEVKRTNRGPQIVVSRSHRNMLRRLLEFEVPEIYNGQVEIKSIAREAGYRSKVAVAALQEGVDPVGACVGMRGMRIQNIVRELHEEKIDVIEWNSDPKAFIAKALSPARVTGVYLEDDPDSGRTAVVIVPDDQLSLAIGREGQNARLAAKLTGWRIDIKNETESVQNAMQNIDKPPLDVLRKRHKDLVAQIEQIMQKRADERTVMPEEYQLLGRFANLVETRLVEAREEERQAKLAEIEAVKATLPEQLFETPIEALDVDEQTHEALTELENVGEVMWRFLYDERQISRLLKGHPNEAFEKLKASLDDLMMAAMMGDLEVLDVPAEVEPEPEVVEPEPEVEAEVEIEPELEVMEPEVEAEPEPEVVEPEPVASVEVYEEPVPEVVDDDEEAPAVLQDASEATAPQEAPEELPTAFPEVPMTEEEIAALEEEERQAKKKQPKRTEVALEPEEDFDLDDDLDDEDRQRTRKKSKRKRRQLVYDEDSGRVVSKRKRKGSRQRDSWEDFID